MDKIKSEKPLFSRIFPFLTQHPFIVTGVLCLLCLMLTTGKSIYFVSSVILTVGVFFLGVCASTYIVIHDIKNHKKQLTVIFILGSAIAALAFYMFVFNSGNIPYLLLNTGFIVIFGIVVYLGLTDRLTTDKVILLIFAAGFLIRLVYIMYTPITVRQHDVRTFGNGSGHAGYIEYLYENGRLPDIDVRTVWQFYHPPLHHALAAIWLKIQTLFGMSFKNACENIQILTLFYSSICMIISYKIFRQLKLKKQGLIAACAIIAFCPTFFILAGSINNDILSITFILGAVLNTIYWYKNQSFKHIIAIALCIGLGMMTKLSVWMVAPAVAFVFIYVFFKKIKSFKKHLLQFAVFGIICCPLGLWWSFKNYIGYGVPFSYVPMLTNDSKQYIGNIPILQRIFDFNFEQFSTVENQFVQYGSSYNEYNPLIALFKTSMFDEGITVGNYPNIAIWNKILFWSAVIIGLIGFVSMIYGFIKKNSKIDLAMKVFIFMLYSVTLVSYYVFCFEFAHVCTQNVRYAVILIVIGAYFVGTAIQNLSAEDSKGRVSVKLTEDGVETVYTESGEKTIYKKAMRYIVWAAVILFCMMSFLVYDIVAMTPIK